MQFSAINYCLSQHFYFLFLQILLYLYTNARSLPDLSNYQKIVIIINHSCAMHSSMITGQISIRMNGTNLMYIVA